MDKIVDRLDACTSGPLRRPDAMDLLIDPPHSVNLDVEMQAENTNSDKVLPVPASDFGVETKLPIIKLLQAVRA